MASPAKSAAGLPAFATLDELVIGAPCNLFELFLPSSLRLVIDEQVELAPSARILWGYLVHQCQWTGFYDKSQTHLGAKIGLSPRQTREHLHTLSEAKVLHIEPNPGKLAKIWFLCHIVYSECPFRTPAENRRGVRRKTAGGLGGKPPRILKDLLKGFLKLPSEHVVGGRSEQKSDAPEHAKPTPAAGPIPRNGKSRIAGPVGIQVLPNAREFLNGMNTREKQIHYASGLRAAAFVDKYREILKTAKAGAAADARVQVWRYSAELRALGFFLPGTETERKQ